MSTKIYEGPLVFEKMEASAYQGFKAFLAMRYRSKVAGRPMPNITSREFIGWWLEELKTFQGTTPTCGRIDHSKGYSWDNFFMQSKSDNCREVAFRKHSKNQKFLCSQRCVVIDTVSGKRIHEFESQSHAARFFGVDQRTINKLVKNEIKKPGFKYRKQLRNLKFVTKT